MLDRWAVALAATGRHDKVQPTAERRRLASDPCYLLPREVRAEADPPKAPMMTIRSNKVVPIAPRFITEFLLTVNDTQGQGHVEPSRRNLAAGTLAGVMPPLRALAGLPKPITPYQGFRCLRF